jgi:hypothetical protein
VLRIGCLRYLVYRLDRWLPLINPPFCECRQLSEKELEWNRAARGPRVLVMFRFGKREVK